MSGTHSRRRIIATTSDIIAVGEKPELGCEDVWAEGARGVVGCVERERIGGLAVDIVMGFFLWLLRWIYGIRWSLTIVQEIEDLVLKRAV